MDKWISDTNDVLALILLLVIIPSMWIADAYGVISLKGEVLGATIMGWTLVLQYYFRRRKPTQ